MHYGTPVIHIDYHGVVALAHSLVTYVLLYLETIHPYYEGTELPPSEMSEQTAVEWLTKASEMFLNVGKADESDRLQQILSSIDITQ